VHHVGIFSMVETCCFLIANKSIY